MEIRFEQATYGYGDWRKHVTALDRFSLSVRGGSFTVVLGAPGSGKSTLLQHMNGLLLPTGGAVQVGERRLAAEQAAGISGVNGESSINSGSGVNGGSGINGGSGVNGGSGINGGSGVNGESSINSGSEVNGGSGINGGSGVNGGSGINGGSGVNGESRINGGSGVNDSGVNGGSSINVGSGINDGAEPEGRSWAGRMAARRWSRRARKAHARAQAQSLREVRRVVGLVFQFPEKQLFEDTVLKDIAFGPFNFGMSEREAEEAARRAAKALDLDEELLQRSPFELSDGQRRKAAIAAVLAAGPDVIALDEPTASLDQHSRAELMELLQRLCREKGKTIVIVTHRLEEVLAYGERFVVMDEGSKLFEGTADELLRRPDVLERAGIEVPASARLLRKLSERLGAPLPQAVMDAKHAASWIAEAWERREGDWL